MGPLVYAEQPPLHVPPLPGGTLLPVSFLTPQFSCTQFKGDLTGEIVHTGEAHANRGEACAPFLPKFTCLRMLVAARLSLSGTLGPNWFAVWELVQSVPLHPTDSDDDDDIDDEEQQQQQG